VSANRGRVLVTGGAGYIGSHVVLQLRDEGYDVLVYDNLSTGHAWTVGDCELVVADLADADALDAVFRENRFEAVLHFAAWIDVEESVRDPLKYYANNTANTVKLLQACDRAGVERFVFSSTAAVYGMADTSPIPEDARLAPASPYGGSKRMSEQVLMDLGQASTLRYVIFRYFNVAGADPAGNLGEWRKNPTHLIPSALEAAAGGRPKFTVHGDDYPTIDGTCVRDYIHVDDLARAHIDALKYLQDGGESDVFNCGYGHGRSVLEVIEAVKTVTGVDFSVTIGPRRPGDPPELAAMSDKAQKKLGWRPRHDDIEFIVRTAWDWYGRRDQVRAAKIEAMENGKPKAGAKRKSA